LWAIAYLSFGARVVFGAAFGAAISGYLRTIIEVNVAHIEQLTYSEFIHSLPNPTCFNLLKAEQLDGLKVFPNESDLVQFAREGWIEFKTEQPTLWSRLKK